MAYIENPIQEGMDFKQVAENVSGNDKEMSKQITILQNQYIPKLIAQYRVEYTTLNWVDNPNDKSGHKYPTRIKYSCYKVVNGEKQLLLEGVEDTIYKNDYYDTAMISKTIDTLSLSNGRFISYFKAKRGKLSYSQFSFGVGSAFVSEATPNLGSTYGTIDEQMYISDLYHEPTLSNGTIIGNTTYKVNVGVSMGNREASVYYDYEDFPFTEDEATTYIDALLFGEPHKDEFSINIDELIASTDELFQQ